MVEFSIVFSYCSKLYTVFALSKSREWVKELSKVVSCVILWNQKELLSQQVLKAKAILVIWLWEEL